MDCQNLNCFDGCKLPQVRSRLCSAGHIPPTPPSLPGSMKDIVVSFDVVNYYFFPSGSFKQTHITSGFVVCYKMHFVFLIWKRI